MAIDARKNLAKGTLSTGYNNSATSIVLTTGHGARFPVTPFNAIWWNATDYPDPSDDPNVEFVRVTGIASDTFTVTRGQEGLTATTKNTAGKTYKLVAAITAKTIDDIEAAITAITPGTKSYAFFTATDSQPPASAFATLDTRNSIAVLDFDDTTEESAVFVGILPEAAALGSGLKIRIHWMATSATSGNVRWGAAIERMNTDEDSDSFAAAVEAHSATDGTSGIITVTEITITGIDSVAAGEAYRLKIYRDVSDTTNDTVTGDAELVAVEVRSAI